jgi:hypothetical protein
MKIKVNRQELEFKIRYINDSAKSKKITFAVDTDSEYISSYEWEKIIDSIIENTNINTEAVARVMIEELKTKNENLKIENARLSEALEAQEPQEDKQNG